jgi:glyoxylase-like metal-dependent hydrolase (beta-lactamase superfamily II)
MMDSTFTRPYRLLALAAFFLLAIDLNPVSAGQNSYRIERIAAGVYAALAISGSAATSNAFIVDLGHSLVAGGAHFTAKAINDLIAAAADLTPKPISAFVLAHHHQGFSFVDFDFPPGREVIMTVDTRQVMRREVRQMQGQITYFGQGLTLEGTERSLVLTNVGAGHSGGDLIAYIPQSKTLFTNDLVYNNSAGYLGDGPLRNWVMILDNLARLDVERVIPGFGPTGGPQVILDFQRYLKSFLTETLNRIENGEPLYQVLQNHSIADYENLPGYPVFRSGNIERAYRQLSGKEE